MKAVFLTIAISFLLTGCMGVQSHYDPNTGLSQIHSYDNSIFNTSSKLTQYQQCDKNKEQAENCKAIGVYHSDTTGLIPSVGGSALQGFAGSIMIKEGLEDSSSNSSAQSITGIINNNSCQGNCPGGN